MAAPTPVSALVHSSTLVTAGIYLLIRFEVFVFLAGFSIYLVIVGIMTLLVARFSACVEWDSKKIIAFSTLRQLGLMLFSFGKGLSALCFFHLINHAIFKALMFIVIGYFILKKFHFQDLRFLKNISKENSLFLIILLSRILSLRGFPFMVGFYSKDLILERG